MSRRTTLVAVVLGGLAMFSLAQAQNAENNAGGGGGGAQQGAGGRERGRNREGREGRGRAGGFDGARMGDMMKERLGVTDDEWKAMQPKVTKVMDLQRDIRGGFMGGMGRRGGDDAAAGSESKVGEARQALNTALRDKNTSAEDITAKLTAYRDAREKAKTALAEAQKELKTSVNPRQEASLVLAGVLE